MLAAAAASIAPMHIRMLAAGHCTNASITTSLHVAGSMCGGYGGPAQLDELAKLTPVLLKCLWVATLVEN